MCNALVRQKLGFIADVLEDLHGRVTEVALEGHDGTRIDVEGRVHSLDLDVPYIQTRTGEIYPVGTNYAFIEFVAT